MSAGFFSLKKFSFPLRDTYLDSSSFGTSCRVIEEFIFGCVSIALGKCHSRKDGIGDEGERDGGGSLEDTGPLLQVGGSHCFL